MSSNGHCYDGVAMRAMLDMTIADFNRDLLEQFYLLREALKTCADPTEYEMGTAMLRKLRFELERDGVSIEDDDDGEEIGSEVDSSCGS